MSILTDSAHTEVHLELRSCLLCLLTVSRSYAVAGDCCKPRASPCWPLFLWQQATVLCDTEVCKAFCRDVLCPLGVQWLVRLAQVLLFSQQHPLQQNWQ